MDRFLDALSLLLAPLGFVIGIVILSGLELLGAGFLVSVGVLLAVTLLMLLKEYFASRTSIVRPFLNEDQRREHDEMEERDLKIGRYALPLGMVLALLAAQIWSAEAIAEVVFQWI